LLFLLANAGCNFIMGVPGHDDVMLNYVSTSYHDALVLRSTLNLGAAPEFEEWLESRNILNVSERSEGMLIGSGIGKKGDAFSDSGARTI
jgi:ethanolamine ammonia-lyase large subunit